MQNVGSVLGCVPAALHGHLLELRLRLQLSHENLFHQLHLRHYLRHEIQEAILLGKSNQQLFLITLSLSVDLRPARR